MSAEPNLTDQDYALLSAYIDGELSDAERSALELRLQNETALRQELNALRQTIALVKQLPTLKAPRDFVLDARMVEPRALHPLVRPARGDLPRTRWLRFTPLAAAVAAMVIVIFFGLFVFNLMMGPAIGNVFSNIVSALDGGLGAGAPAVGEVAQIPTEGAQMTNTPATFATVTAPTDHDDTQRALTTDSTPEAFLLAFTPTSQPETASSSADSAVESVESEMADGSLPLPEEPSQPAAAAVPLFAPTPAAPTDMQEETGGARPPTDVATVVAQQSIQPVATTGPSTKFLEATTTSLAQVPTAAASPTPTAADADLITEQPERDDNIARSTDILLLGAGVLLLGLAGFIFIMARRRRK